MKRDRKGRMEKCATKERKVWTCARGKRPERDRYGIQIMVVEDGVSLQLHMYEKIFVSQADSALCQFMITTAVTRGADDGDG